MNLAYNVEGDSFVLLGIVLRRSHVIVLTLEQIKCHDHQP